VKTFEDILKSDIDKNKPKLETTEELNEKKVWLYKIVSGLARVDHFRKPVNIYYQKMKYIIFKQLYQNRFNI